MDELVQSLSSNPLFLAGWIRSITSDSERVREDLGLTGMAWNRLLLSKTPRPQCFYPDVKVIAEHAGADPNALAFVLRELAAVGSIRLTDRISLSAAARDAHDNEDALAVPKARSSSRHYAALLQERMTNLPVIMQLEQKLTFALPICVVELPDLTLSRVSRWLARHEIAFSMHKRDRELMGLLLAARGNGLIFLNSGLPHDEKDFTLLHEIGHFIFDHLVPRDNVMRHDPDLVEVFDGDRPASSRDKAISFLHNVDIGVHSHLLDRDGSGQSSFDTGLHEDHASWFALEFLAPALEVSAYLRDRLNRSASYSRALNEAEALIAGRFPLPREAARLRAIEAVERLGVRKSVIDP